MTGKRPKSRTCKMWVDIGVEYPNYKNSNISLSLRSSAGRKNNTT